MRQRIGCQGFNLLCGGEQIIFDPLLVHLSLTFMVSILDGEGLEKWMSLLWIEQQHFLFLKVGILMDELRLLKKLNYYNALKLHKYQWNVGFSIQNLQMVQKSFSFVSFIHILKFQLEIQTWLKKDEFNIVQEIYGQIGCFCWFCSTFFPFQIMPYLWVLSQPLPACNS